MQTAYLLCVRACISYRLPAWKKALSHWWHTNCCSPVWDILCVIRWLEITESLVTMVACKLLLSCVGKIVSLQTIWPRESFATRVAGKLLLPCVGEPVTGQVTWCIESLITLDTGKRLYSCVGEIMFLQVTWHKESLITLNVGETVSLLCGISCVYSGFLTERKPYCTGCRQTASLLCGKVCASSGHWTLGQHGHIGCRKIAFSPVWESLCLFRLPDSEKAFSHWLQENGFSPVWESLCLFRSPEREKYLTHLMQENSVSPVCDIWWGFWLFDWVQLVPQKEQENCLSLRYDISSPGVEISFSLWMQMSSMLKRSLVHTANQD